MRLFKRKKKSKGNVFCEKCRFLKTKPSHNDFDWTDYDCIHPKNINQIKHTSKSWLREHMSIENKYIQTPDVRNKNNLCPLFESKTVPAKQLELFDRKETCACLYWPTVKQNVF